MYPEYELGPNGISSGHVHSLLSESDGKFSVDAEKVSRLLEYFEKSQLSTLLLSSEHFFYHAEAIASLIPKVRFIAYVRCPIETFESVYNQSVKRHGQTKTLSFSKNLHTTTLNRLSDLAIKLPKNRFHFRAYLSSGEHFNLVSDFLSVFGLEYPVNNEKTNSSYTFEALETKRWLNLFELNGLDAEIDYALQTMNEGVAHYTLLPADMQERHLKQCVQNLKLFHTKHHIKNARNLFDAISKRENMNPVCQGDSTGPLLFASEWLFREHQPLYVKICEALYEHPVPGTEPQIKLFTRYNSKVSAFTYFSSALKRLLRR